jgi:predicted TIM-barrel fold metal-dependent hydrolase
MRIEDMVMVSVDDHAVEPPEAFVRHYGAKYKDEAPRIIDRNGKDVWLWNDKLYPTIGLNAVVGRPRSEYGMEPTRFEQMRPASFDPKERLDDMNVNGILGSLNFPSMPSFAGQVFIAQAGTAPDKALRAMAAWNDWYVLEWCAAGPGRYIPNIILPVWDMDATLAEVKRMSSHGVHNISFSDNPALLGLPSVHNAYWEPFWKACVDHEMLLNCHIGSGAAAPHASAESPIDAWITTMPISIVNSAADWLFASFWKQYPTLRMALSEGGIGWIPYLLERADFTYEHHHEWTFTDFGNERPSDVFKRHIATCFIDDQFGLKSLAYMNEDMVCYECDYPHSDTLWPNSPEHAWANLTGLSDATIDKVTHLNAMRLTNFHPFEQLGGREKCTVGALRALATHVDVSPRHNLGGLRTESMDLVGKARRPVTSGEIQTMFASV